MKSYSLQKGLGWPDVLFGLLVFVAAILIFLPLIFRSSPGEERTKALANAKSVVGGLISFKDNYGSYPCDETRIKLEGNPHDSSINDPLFLDVGPNVLPSGTSANAYLAQLIASDMIDQERVFFAPGVPGTREGDGIMGSADKLLAPGENGFAYIMAPDGMPLTDTKSYTPLVLAPVKGPGEHEPVFDPKVYGGKLVYGLVDGSSSVVDIDEDGKAISLGRKSFFQRGRDSLFGTDTPVVKYPLIPTP